MKNKLWLTTVFAMLCTRATWLIGVQVVGAGLFRFF